LVSVALLAALALVFVMGMAVQRGNTCTVVAFDDLPALGSLGVIAVWFFDE